MGFPARGGASESTTGTSLLLLAHYSLEKMKFAKSRDPVSHNTSINGKTTVHDNEHIPSGSL